MAAFDAAIGAGRPVAVLDRRWPATLRRDATRTLLGACDPRVGWVGEGDLVLFTSGSAGRPRAVLRTAASWLDSFDAVTDLLELGRRDSVWVPGPLASTLSLYGAWHAYRCGAALPGLAAGSRRGGRGSAQAAGATVLHAVPAALADAVRAGQAGLLPRMRCAVVAGAALPLALRSAAQELGWRVVEYYGAAELSFVAVRDSTSGYQPFPAARLRVAGASPADETGGTAAVGGIWVSSPYLAKGYLDPDDDGPLVWERVAGRLWASVGDLGRWTPGGLQVLGRGAGAVTTGGHTVLAAEVESVLLQCAGILGAVVVGTPHLRLGEVVTAVVERQPPGPEVARATLQAACRGLPTPARPRRWLAVAQLPRNAAGKPDRAAVQAGLADGTLPATRLR